MSEELVTPVTGKAAKRAVAATVDAVAEPAAVMAEAVDEMVEVAAPEPEVVEAVVETIAETPEVVMEAIAETVETVVAPMMGTAAEVVEEVVEPMMETVAEVVEAAMPEPVPTPAVSSVFKVFDFAVPNTAAFEQSARNAMAFADASTAMAKGMQEASRTWLEAAKTGAALQREGLKQVAAAKSVASLIGAYSDLTQRNMTSFVDCTQKMTRMSLQTAETARKILRAAA